MILSAIGAGLVLGLLGAGGGIIMVPVFIYLLKLPPKMAIAHSLGIIVCISLFTTIREYRKKNIELRRVLFFAAGGILGSFGAARFVSPYVAENVQILSFILILWVASFLMLRSTFKGPIGGNQSSVSLPAFYLFPMGLVVGVISGMLGIGGGFLIVPMLTLLGGLPIKRAASTSIAIVFINALGGFLGYLTTMTFDPTILTTFSITGILAAQFGVHLRQRLPEKQLRIIFSVLVFCVSLFMAYDKLLS